MERALHGVLNERGATSTPTNRPTPKVVADRLTDPSERQGRSKLMNLLPKERIAQNNWLQQ